MSENKLKNIFSIIFNIILVLALVLGLYYGMYRLKLVTLPQFLESLFQSGKDINQITVIPGDDGEIYQSLKRKESTQTVSIKTNLSHDNIKQLLKNISENTHYYWEAKVTLYSSGKQLQTKSIIRRYESNFRIENYNSAGTLLKAAADNKTTLTEKTFNPTTRSYSIKNYPTGSMSMFLLAGVPDTNSFLEYGDSENALFSLIESDLGTLLCLEFEKAYKQNTQKELYFISLDYGITVRAETYENDALVYLCETTALKDLSNPPQDLFVIE